MSLTIDVVVPTHDGWPVTRRCLEHLRAQTREHTLIVSDDASSDGTVENVRDTFPEALIAETGDHLGFAVACNLGVTVGDGEIVVLVNNDVECRPDFLEKLVAPFDDDRIGMVAALLVKPGEREIDNVGVTADVTLAGFSRLHNEPVERAFDERPLVTGPSGGAAAYRRAAWEAAGGLDERLFAYSEDLELAFRLRAAGWAEAVAPEAVGVHLGSATSGFRSSWQRYHSAFSRAYILRRYGVLRSRVAARALVGEAVVVIGDAVTSRDLSALRGRLAGWQAAKGLARLPAPPSDAIDAGVGLWSSLQLRRRAYRR